MLTFHQGYLAYSWPLIPKEKHIMKEMKPTEGVKKRGLFPSFLINRPQWAESQWTNPKLLEYEQQQSSWAQIPLCVWLAEQQILNIIESLQRPGLRGFEIWYSWWKLCRKKKKTRGMEGCFKCFESLGWNKSGFIRPPKHFHGNQRKRSWTEIKASKRITELRREPNF